VSRRDKRRSISVRGTTYERVKLYVAEHGGSISGFVEATVLEVFGEATEEDRRKFGEEMERREKEAAAKKAEEKPDDLDDYIPPIQFF
jgi:hypothetical protein